jgi:hypothetical protein
MVDWVDDQVPCLVRQVRIRLPLHFILSAESCIRLDDFSQPLAGAGCDGAWLLEAPAGTFFYHTYPFPKPNVHIFAWRGAVRVERCAAENKLEVVCQPGEAVLFFAGGPAYPDAVQHLEAMLRSPVDESFQRTLAAWQTWSQQRPDFAARIPSSESLHAQLIQAVDDTAVLLRAQQSVEGGVLAGHNYHMCYVRDQYGASRGLLALGHVKEARAILEFYWGVWQRYRRIHNAQSAGVDGAFHIHENDEVEITGYLIRQAFDLAEHDGDWDFTGRIFPMLAWAWEAQARHLVDDMLPFNGDETYIAGGILPRSTLNDGSAEATLLFIDGGEKLLRWAGQTRRWNAAALEERERLHASVRASFKRNFWQNGQLVTNNPARRQKAVLPRFRHGVCERCVVEGTVRGIEWTERNALGRYLCPRCLAIGSFPAADSRIYALQSVSLTPFYFQSSLISPEMLSPVVHAILEQYQTTGRLPSRPDDPNGIAVGYDYGLLLYALTSLRHPAARQLAGQTLALIDPAGAWVEYYVNHRPQGTRCRPWESAVNIEALIRWVSSEYIEEPHL